MDSKTIERIALWCFVTIVMTAIVLMFACAFLMTVGTDEAWVLMGIRSCFEPVREGFSSNLIPTSGGVFSLVQAIVTLVVPDSIFLHRLLPLFSILVVFAASGLVASDQGTARGRSYAMLMPAVLLIGFPGTLIVGSTALGTAPAFLMLLIASRYWFASTERQPNIILAGVLFGLAAATRMDVVMFAPALVIHAVLFPSSSRSKGLVQAIVVSLVGVAVLYANRQLHVAMSAVPRPDPFPGTATGISGDLFDYPKLLNKFLIANAHVSLGIIVAISLLTVHRYREKKDGAWQTFLVCFGVIAWTVWIVRAPIPHMRYLWPSLAAFAVVAGVNLARICLQDNVAVWLRVFCVAIAVGFAADGIGTTFRHLVCGQSDIVSWEYSREIGLDYYRRFQQRQDEQKIESFFAESAAGKNILVVGPPFRYRYLGAAPCFKFSAAPEQADEALLLLGPEVGTLLYIRPRGHQYIETNGHLVAEIGEHSFYRIPSVSDFVSLEPFVRAGYYAHPQSQAWFGMP